MNLMHRQHASLGAALFLQAFDPRHEQVAEKIYQGGYQFNELAPT